MEARKRGEIEGGSGNRGYRGPAFLIVGTNMFWHVYSMNFSVHLDDEVLAALEDLAHRAGKSRNAMIGIALREYVARNLQRGWSLGTLSWFEGGVSEDLPPFESYRSELGHPRDLEL